MELAIPNPVGDSGKHLLRTGGLGPRSPSTGVVDSCPAPKALLLVDSCPSPKVLSWVGSCPALNMLSWVGSLSPLPDITIFMRTRHVSVLRFLFLPRRDSSLVFLPPSPPPKAVPDAGQFQLPLTPLLLRFLATPRGLHGLHRSTGCSETRRTVGSSTIEFYTGHRPRRDSRFECVPLRLVWHPSPFIVDESPTNSNSNGKRTPTVDYGFRRGGCSPPSSRRSTTLPRVPRPRTLFLPTR